MLAGGASHGVEFSDEAVAAINERLVRLSERLATLKTTITEVAATASTLSTIHGSGEVLSTNAEPMPDMGVLQANHEALERQYKEIVKDAPADLPATMSLEDLEKRREGVEKERRALAEKLDDLNSSGADGSGKLVLKAESQSNAGQKFIALLLTNGRVVPQREPYFAGQFMLGRNNNTGQLVPCVSFKRQTDGILAEEAVSQGGILDNIIRQDAASPTSHVFLLRVCSDSVSAFHTVRRAVAARGFGFSWDTAEDSSVLIPLNSQAGGSSRGPGLGVYRPGMN
ncbi:MAG TPA: hypothetical protein PLU30_01330 [Verrucomicrobiae bacterium]|nr:hypothetical protein [Verrucomicrobiae bacterium]